MSAQEKHLVVIAGPTGIGKTGVAIDLASRLETEIVSADSRQIYREMHIGVARPKPEELARVRHHLIAEFGIDDPFTAGRYEREALSRIEGIFEKHNSAVLVGGTGFYIDAVLYGLG